MWCTRWYLPLVLLPMPIAPPYYLLLFLFSTTMHARPCFYCMVLLTAMFMSTCYWPPIPIQTPLVRPWAENVTTFADALYLMMPNLPEEKVPTTIAVADRCWCDLSNGFFASFNTTKWEEESVVRLKDSLEKEMAEEEEEREKRECEKGEGEDAGSSACAAVREQHQVITMTSATSFFESYSDRRPYIWDMFRAFKFASTPSILNVSSTEDDTNVPPTSASTPGAVDSKKTDIPVRSTAPQPWLRREYDLRQFGFAMVLDFGWIASHS
ncbi:hypothetical protein LXA43DRAFT_980838 [Ganoderma leucocontextum]|nr:hypothetical protein LXA43DRAFT_980838 [Ganoderma leucocontextum]